MDGVRYLYLRMHKEDTLVVPYNPEIALYYCGVQSIMSKKYL